MCQIFARFDGVNAEVIYKLRKKDNSKSLAAFEKGAIERVGECFHHSETSGTDSNSNIQTHIQENMIV